MGSAYIVVLNDFEATKEAFIQDAFMGRPPKTPFNLNKETIGMYFPPKIIIFYFLLFYFYFLLYT